MENQWNNRAGEPKMTEYALSPLDQAHAYRLEGHEEPSLRLAIACALADSETPGPIALIARILVDQERELPAAAIAERLVDAFIRRGDLPSAVVASTVALDAGQPQRPLLTAIAKAFSKAATKPASGGVKPPPIPREPELSDDLNKLTGDALYAEAERVLSAYLAAPDALPSDDVPNLPLFGTLDQRELEQLLSAVRVEEVSQGHEIVRQGDPGSEAFVVARGALKVVRREGADETLLARLGPGQIFGEMALISESPRSASVVALEPALLLVLARDELERAAEDAPELSAQLSAFCHGRMHANLIRHARVLSGLAREQRSELLATLESRFFEASTPLIEQGQEGNSIFLIASGAVSISVPEDGERLVLATLGPGEVVGEMSLILRRPASADVFALYPTVAYELSADKLQQLMRVYPALLVELYDLATRRDEEIRATEGSEALSADDILV
ncbi:MAG: cAMP-binding protein [Myxococcaceae bacterium]|nr:cAMP-binding protein [Myxococcaceae bacterium]